MKLLRLRPAMGTHRGMRRKLNEDAVGLHYPASAQTMQQYGALLVVADGVGGLTAGDRASQMAVEQFIAHYYKSDIQASIAEHLLHTTQRVNNAILNGLQKQAATTLVAAVIHGSELSAVSLGDSLLFHLHQGQIEQLNEVDVLDDDSSDAGALTKVIGYRELPELPVLHRSLSPGDQVLLCTDGLTRYVEDALLVRYAALRDPRDGVRRMITEANTNGGADNISAVLVHIGDVIPAEEHAAHVQDTAVRVSITSEPLMKADVPSKPTTQIPTAAPEPVGSSAPATPAPFPRVMVPPTPQRSQAPARSNRLLWMGAGVLLMGALVIGGGILLLSQPGDSGAAPLTPNPSSPAEGTASDAPSTTEGLRVGDIVVLSESVLTLAQVGGEVGSFVAAPQSPYRIDERFEDSEGQVWYRLLEESTEQTGWVTESELPAYQQQPDG